MATVYLARDTRHDRKVALKVLEPELAAAVGAERFLAEIKTTANLQHPHVVSLHDSGVANVAGGTVLYYVMPYVEGESLRQRLERERILPVEDAVRIAREVAEALEYAHGQGIVHRDVKPENILLQRGHAVVADFGIALAVQQAGTARLTQTGLSLGTPQYMSPEQAMGERTIDARADVYALGAVTYEMLAGEPPFTGPSMQAIVARILAEEPRAIAPQRKSVPPHVEAAVLKALEKVPADRFASAHEYGAALLDIMPLAEKRRSTSGDRWREAAIVAIVACGLLGGTLALRIGASPVAASTLTSTLMAPDGAPSDLSDVALSPDGAVLAFVSSTAVDGGRIWLRQMADGAARPLSGTEGARWLFWSPDGASIGFFPPGSLRTIDVASGAIRTLAPAPNPAPGAAWSPTGTIVYSPFYDGLWSLAASGGSPKRLAAPGKDARVTSFLSDGRHFLYWQPGERGKTSIAYVGDVATGDARTIAEGISNPRYVEPGYLLYFTEGERGTLERPAALFAQAFDPGKAALKDKPVQLSAAVDRPLQNAVFSAAADVLVMRESRAANDVRAKESVYWLDRASNRTTAINGAGTTWSFRISHDGGRVAFGGDGLWLHDPTRDVSVRIPTSSASPWPPVWSPDDRSIAVKHASNIMVIGVGTGAAERILEANDDAAWADPVDWSPDGSAIYYVREPAAARPQWELWRYVIAGGRVENVPTGPGNVLGARVSPDSKWIAWESDATGRQEIYLGPIGGTTAPTRISKAGGGSPRWRGDGRELFFIGGDGRLASATIDLRIATPVVGEPHVLSPVVVNPEPFGRDPFLHTRFEVTPKGDRLLVQKSPDAGIYQLTLIQGWQRRLARR